MGDDSQMGFSINSFRKISFWLGFEKLQMYALKSHICLHSQSFMEWLNLEIIGDKKCTL
jgi:hypothetical protein